MQPQLPYSRQQIDEDDIAAVAECLRGDFLTTGPRVEAFEAALRDKVRSEFVIACSNGTAALHLASCALKLCSNDQVIVPSLTFLATANAPHLAGAEVVFADVDAQTGLLTADTFDEALRRAPRARAVYPVHLNGSSVAMPAVRAIAKKRGLAVVEDACHALATTYLADGREGTIGDCCYSEMAAFSFHPVKAIAMGEGGAVTTNDSGLAASLRLLRNHGMTRTPDRFSNPGEAYDPRGQLNPWYYEMPMPGFNYRVPDILCALGISQLKKVDSFVTRRRQLAALYDDVLSGLAPNIVSVPRAKEFNSAFHLYVVMIDFSQIGCSRAEVMTKLRAEGIFTQVHYMPVHMQPYYRDQQPLLRLPGAEAYYRRALSLPLFPAMTEADVLRVVEALARATGLGVSASSTVGGDRVLRAGRP